MLYYPGWGAATLSVSDDGIFVGQKGNNAFKFTTAANSAVNLPHLSALNVSAAMAINPQGDGPTPNPGENYRYIVGSSRHATGVDRPVVWWGGSATPTDLVNAGVSIVAADGKGLATGVNDVGEVVGWAELKVGTGTAKATRAFRSRAADFLNALPLVAGDELLPLGSQTDVNNLAVAWAIGANNIAVGGSIVKVVNTLTTNAVFWTARNGVSANPVASKLLDLPSRPVIGGQSEATAINYDTTPPGNAGYNRSYIGGWSFDGTTNRATLWRGVSTTVPPLDLNDQHFAYRGTSWWLETIEAINNSKAMVGTGWFNGKRRGYLLVPLTPGN